MAEGDTTASSLSPSQRAGMESGDAVFHGMFNTVAKGLGDNYSAIYNGLQNKSGLRAPNSFKDDADYQKFIGSLTTTVLENNTDVAKEIRGIYRGMPKKQGEPAEIPTLDDLYKARRAATNAVSDNTGDMEFLGGSTIWSAIVALFQWIFSGFEGGFDGLKNTIATRAVGNITADFEANLKAEGVPAELSAALVKELEGAAKVKAGLAAPDSVAPPPTLEQIKRPADVKVETTTVTAGKEQDAVIDHYGKLAKAVKGIQLVSDKLPQNFEAVVSESAKEVYADVKSRKDVTPQEMDKLVLIKAIDKIEAKDKAEKKTSDPVLAQVKTALSKAESIDAAAKALNPKDNDDLVSQIALNTINEVLIHKDRFQDRLKLFREVGLMDDASAKAAEEAHKKAPPPEKIDYAQLVRVAINDKFTNDTTIQAQLSPGNILQNLNNAISQKAGGWNNGTTRFLSDIAGSVGFGNEVRLPTDDEKKKLANYLSGLVPTVVKGKLADAIINTNPGGKPDADRLDIQKLRASIRADFKAKLSDKNNKSVPDFWKTEEKLGDILDTLDAQLEKPLNQAKAEIKKTLGGNKTASLNGRNGAFDKLLASENGVRNDRPTVATYNGIPPRTPVVAAEANPFARLVDQNQTLGA